MLEILSELDKNKSRINGTEKLFIQYNPSNELYVGNDGNVAKTFIVSKSSREK